MNESLIQQLEGRLTAARERQEEICRELAARHPPELRQEYWAVSETVLGLERELAAARGEEYAVPLDFPVKWSPAAPLPHLLTNGSKTFVTFYLHRPDPAWDGTYVTVKDPADGSIESLALVEFLGCVSTRFGDPNDEVFHGHPLYGKGLDWYGAQKVENSRWLAELQAINRVHDQHSPTHWEGLTHYVFWFHDETFECVAKSYQVECFRESMWDLLARVCQRLLSRR